MIDKKDIYIGNVLYDDHLDEYGIIVYVYSNPKQIGNYIIYTIETNQMLFYEQLYGHIRTDDNIKTVTQLISHYQGNDILSKLESHINNNLFQDADWIDEHNNNLTKIKRQVYIENIMKSNGT